MFYQALSFLPILILLVISLWKGVKVGVYTGLLVTTILFFVWDSQWAALPASLVAALVDTVSILLIVFGAILLYQTMQDKGFINGIQTSLQGIHTNKNFQFYFLAFFLTAFFESVAGFGTPGAIVPLLLISMGFSPILSISAVLLIDGLFAISGAVGTPVSVGLQTPLALNTDQAGLVYLYAAIGVAVAGAAIVFSIDRSLKKEIGQTKNYGWLIYLLIIIPFVLLSYYLRELTGILAAASMAVICYFFFFTSKEINWRSWYPYALLIGILLLPKIIVPLREFLALKIPFDNLFDTGVSAHLQPLRSPFLPFVIAAVFAAWLSKDISFSVKPVLSKTGAVFLVLFPSLAITRLMLSSGTTMPSMVEMLGSVFGEAGVFYPVLSPLVGILGAFITGSTTVSNVIFGPVQDSAAGQMGFPREVILALQLAGASLGNAVCLFNIIAAAAVADVKDYSGILKNNLVPVLIASLLASAVGYLLIYLF